MWARIPLLIFGIPALYYLLHLGQLSRLLLIAVVSIAAIREFFNIMDQEGNFSPMPEYLFSLFILSMANFLGSSGLLAGVAGAMTLLMLMIVGKGLQGNGTRRFSIGLFSMIYIPFCLSFFILVGNSVGPLVLFLILLIIWALDTGAYLSGMLIGGPKIAPQISPKKTVAGAVGGTVFVGGATLALSHYQWLAFSQKRLIAFAIAISVIGQAADLFESVLKREAGIKDSGTLMGAHGGILDRIDSVLLIGPVSYFFLLS